MTEIVQFVRRRSNQQSAFSIQHLTIAFFASSSY